MRGSRSIWGSVGEFKDKDDHKNKHKRKIDCDLKNEVEGMDFQIEEDLKNWDNLMNKDNFRNNETP